MRAYIWTLAAEFHLDTLSFLRYQHLEVSRSAMSLPPPPFPSPSHFTLSVSPSITGSFLTTTSTIPARTSDSTTSTPSTFVTQVPESFASRNGLSIGAITGISVAAGLVFLGALAALLITCVRRRKRLQRFGYDKPTNNTRSNEKYEGDGEQTPYGQRISITENGGSAPLLTHANFHFQDSRPPVFREDPESPFVNNEHAEMAMDHVRPISSLHDLTRLPYLMPDQDHDEQTDVVTLLPSTPSRDSERGDVKLPPLTIPEYSASVPRRPSRGKHSMRSTKSSRLVDGYESDDTASMYSQASASTISSRPQHKVSQSAYSAVPVGRSDSLGSEGDSTPVAVTAPRRQHSAGARTVSIHLAANEEAGLERQDTAVIASLLASRARQNVESMTDSASASRSSSLISHIERSGSIKTPNLSEVNRESYGRRLSRTKQTRDAQFPAMNRSSVVPELPESSIV